MEKFKPGHMYYVDGNSLNGILTIAALLSGGASIDADKRRDLGQWIQVHLDMAVEAPDDEGRNHGPATC